MNRPIMKIWNKEPRTTSERQNADGESPSSQKTNKKILNV